LSVRVEIALYFARNCKRGAISTNTDRANSIADIPSKSRAVENRCDRTQPWRFSLTTECGAPLISGCGRPHERPAEWNLDSMRLERRLANWMNHMHLFGNFVSPRLLTIAAFAAVFGAFGCKSKVADCNKVITVVNAHAAEPKLEKPEDFEAFAKDREKTATEIKALEIADEGVKAKANALADTETKAATTIHGMVAGMKGADAEATQKGAAALGDIAAQNKKAIEDFETYCKQ
jgi:hypothetical protein